MIIALLDKVEPKWDVVIPVSEEGKQPLCAIYSKRCIKPIERQLKNEEPKIVKFFPRVNVQEVPEAQLRSADPHLVSFVNINTPEDLTVCEKILTGS